MQILCRGLNLRYFESVRTKEITRESRHAKNGCYRQKSVYDPGLVTLVTIVFRQGATEGW